MVTADLSNLWGDLKLNDVLGMEEAVAAAHARLSDGTGPGKEYLGWYYLPANVDLRDRRRLRDAAQRIQDTSSVLVVIGAGGSYLGARAGIELLCGSRHNQRAQGTRVYFAGNNLSTRSMRELLDLLEGQDFSLNIVSKSGSTTEPAIAARLLRWQLERRYGADKAKSRIIVTTDPTEGALRQMAQEEGYETFSIPPDVGGRYSVLTPAGLLPMAVAGVDISGLLSGARDEMEALEERSFENPAWMYAVARYLLHQQGKQIELLCAYEPDFETFGRWWQQLFGESEGKEGKGLFPACASFTSDLHSLGQMIQQGRRNLFETVVQFAPSARDLEINLDWKDTDNLNYLAGKSLAFVQKQAMAATTSAHVDGDVPVITLDAEAINADSVGALIYFFELSCGLSAYLLGVNPFDQPGVESYKRNMYALLGKPGYSTTQDQKNNGLI